MGAKLQGLLKETLSYKTPWRNPEKLYSLSMN